mgnify:CR=1 FL=1|jgi:hypothetical protein
MREVIKILKSQHGKFVICGSLALYLHGLIDDYNDKEIDIIVDQKISPFNEVPKPIFSCSGSSYKINNVFIDVFNKHLPEHDKVVVDGLIMYIKTLSALKNHYLSLDMNTIGGHDKFKAKMMTRIDLFK